MIRSPISISGPHQFQGGTGLFSAGRIPPRWSRTERYCGWSGGYRSSASSTIPTGLTARSCRTMVSSGSIVAANARLPLLGSHDVIRSRGRDRGCEKARKDTNADGAGEESAKNHALQTSSCTGVQAAIRCEPNPQRTLAVRAARVRRVSARGTGRRGSAALHQHRQDRLQMVVGELFELVVGAVLHRMGNKH